MSKSTYLLKLPTSVKTAAARLTKAEGASNPLTRPGRRMQTASLIGESRRPFAEFINPLRCFGLRQRAIEFFTGLSTQRLQVRALCVGHRFIASFPFVRVALQRRLSGIIR
jgi:hypothetical protein